MGALNYVNIGSGNGLLPDSQGIAWTNVDLPSVRSSDIYWGQFHKRYLSQQSLKYIENWSSKSNFQTPRVQRFKSNENASYMVPKFLVMLIPYTI